MPAKFEDVAPLIVKIEGSELTNDPSDHGGKTKYGISQATFPNLNIEDLKEDQAIDLLKKFFWDHYQLSKIDAQNIANQLFFMLVHMNPIAAVKIVQISVNACGLDMIRVTVDGMLGDETFKSINAVSNIANGWLSNRIRLEAINYYLKIVDADLSQEKYFRGWVRRALTQ